MTLRAVTAPRAKRVLGYARVSSEEQARGSSLQDQQDAISRYAEEKGMGVPEFFVEAESAVHEKIERREQIRALMASVRTGDLVVCDKLDRWSRDPEFTYRSIREILAAGASFYAVGDACDPSKPEGDTMLGFRVLFAREEHKRIKQRMVGTRQLLRDRGYYAEGLPPFGYRRALPVGKKGPDKNVLRMEEAEADLVRKAFRLCIAGRSLTQIASALDLSRDRVRDVLRNRVYVGDVRSSGGAWIKGMHEAMVDADVFTRAQAALDSRRLGGARPRGAPSETQGWILRDVACCGRCGARMSAAYAGPHDARRYYYKCSKTCGGTGKGRTAFVPVGRIEATAEPMIVGRLEELREELGREPKQAKSTAPVDFVEKRARLQKRRAGYLDAFADGLMTKEELRASLAKLDDEALRLEADEEARRRTNPLATAAVRRAALREVGAIARAWAKASAVAKRAIVRNLASAARVSADGTCVFTWRPVEDLLAKA